MPTMLQRSEHVSASGILITRPEGRLRVRGPEGLLMPQRRQRLRDRRDPRRTGPRGLRSYWPVERQRKLFPLSRLTWSANGVLSRGVLPLIVKPPEGETRRHMVLSIAPGAPGRVSSRDLLACLWRNTSVGRQPCALITCGGTIRVGHNLTFDWPLLAAYFGAYLAIRYPTSCC
jgi:hypothetical protein